MSLHKYAYNVRTGEKKYFIIQGNSYTNKHTHTHMSKVMQNKNVSVWSFLDALLEIYIENNNK